MANIKNLVFIKKHLNRHSKENADSVTISDTSLGIISNNTSSPKIVKIEEEEEEEENIVKKKKPKRVQFGDKIKEFGKNLRFPKRKFHEKINDDTYITHSSRNVVKTLTTKMSFPPTTLPTHSSKFCYSRSASTIQKKLLLSEEFKDRSNSDILQSESLSESDEMLKLKGDERMELHMHVNRLINHETSEESNEESDIYDNEDDDFTTYPLAVKTHNGKTILQDSFKKQINKKEEEKKIEEETIGKKIEDIYNDTYGYTKHLVTKVYDAKLNLYNVYEKVSECKDSILDSAELLLHDSEIPIDTNEEDKEGSEELSAFESTLDNMCGYIIFVMTNSIFDLS